jgi:type VI secretion system protein VasD
MLNLSRATCLAFAALLSGCGVWQAASDGTVNAYDTIFHNRGKVLSIDLAATANLNPDDSGHPRAVAVRVYQLKDRKRFDAASYPDLLVKDEIVLAPDVQAHMATVINPGGSASVSQPLEKDTEFVGIAAFYQSTDKTRAWKHVITTSKLPGVAPLTLTLESGDLELSNGAKTAKK